MRPAIVVMLIGVVPPVNRPPALPAPESTERVVRRFYIMGTLATIEAEGPPSVLEPAVAQAFAELGAVDRHLSLFRRNSEIHRINREGAGRTLPVSSLMFPVLAEGLALAQASDGDFDPTMGPLAELWALESDGGPAIPSQRAIDQARSRVGYRRLHLDAARRRVRLGADGMRLNCDAIAKGYAVDRALAVLAEAGLERALVDLGESSIGFFGGKRVLGIRDPLRPDRLLATFEASSASVSTSAGYEKGFERDGHWFSHIIDPRTGRPVERSLSATVVADIGQAMRADGLSTAGFVLGPGSALQLWRQMGVEGVLVFREAGQVHIEVTPGLGLQRRAPTAR